MAGGIEGWHFFDVESGQVPDESAPSALPGGGKGRIVVLAATPFARRDAWASRAAVLLAREWAQEGLRIFLMDLGLEEPSLHSILGLPNGEGVSEAFLFGASVQHIAKPALNNAIFFASAGTPTGDPEEVLGHPRWNDLAGGFSEADATLLLFLPTDIPGAGKILSRATDILFLAGRGESQDRHLGPAAIKAVATLGPLGTPPEESSTEADEPPAGLEEVVSGGFAEEPPQDVGGSSSSGFDFEGTLELADGFGLELTPEESFAEPALEDQEEEVLQGTPLASEGDFGAGDEVLEDSPGVSEAGLDLLEASSMPEEGGVAPSGAGDGEAEVGSKEGDETVRSRAPDFEAHFVDLPPADVPDEPEPPETQFGGDLVQGPDFGSPPPVRVEDEEEPAEAPPDREAPPPARTPRQDEAPPERRRPPRRKPPKKKVPWGKILGFLLALAILGSAVGTAMGYLNVPGFAFLRDFFAEVPDPPLTLAGPQANEPVLRYSLVLFTYEQEELADGLAMLEALQDRLPNLLMTLVPGEADGERIYTLLAGPAVDRVEAEDLRGPIAEVLTREDPASWSVRETPRAFYLGERATLQEARDYIRSVDTDSVHAYILHVTFPEPEGSESYQILAGAFAGVQDARPLQFILRDLGFRDAPLIERRGRLPE